MSSEKPKTQKEQELYEQIKKFLNIVFTSYKEQKPHYQVAPLFSIENPYLEITASGHFSPTLKGVFSDKTLRFLNVEKNLPDIMGFVKKKPSSERELITVEVKRIPIRLFHILKARFYQDIFEAKFGLLFSTKGIIEDKVRFVLDTKIGREIRGKVIIAKYNKPSYGTMSLEINPRFTKSVQEPFKRFCKP